nr:hypothetical protein [Tanacetum cinerariifolium]
IIVPTVGQNFPNSTNTFSVAGPSNAAASPTYGKSSFIDASQLSDDADMPELEDITYSDNEDDVGAKADFNILETSITEPKRVYQALKDPSWIEAMQEEILQFKMQKVWEEGIDYEEVFPLVARIEAIRLFLAYSSFMGFMVYQMDVKSAFLYGTINEEAYVCQPPGFEDPDHLDKVYKVVNALYGLHQAPRACQDKYVAEILRKFGLTEGKSASTPIDTEKPLLKDPDGEDVDVHTYSDYAGASLERKSTTGGCQFLGCRLISWQCKKQTVVATSSTEAEYVAAASCCAQVLWIRNQLLDYGSLKYALTVNPNIYVSCIKQFLTAVVVKQVNDVTRLQALVDRKKAVVTEATIREALRLDDAEGVDYLPNEEIFAELARIGYEKPSTKLTFYKAFFSSQWKFLIHTILQCMSAKRTSWNEFSSSMTSAVICLSSGRIFNFSKYIFDSLVRNVDSTTKFYMYPRFLQLIIRNQVGDLLTHTTKYTSPTLTQKVFKNIRRVGKGFSGVETPLFEGMLVEQEIDEEGYADEHVEEVDTGDAAHGDVSAARGEVPIVTKEPSIPTPTPPTPPPQPPQDIPSTSHVQHTPPQSPQLKRRGKKLEKRNKVRVLKLKKLQKVGTSQRVETSDDTVMDDESNQGRMIAEMDQDDAVVLKDDKEVVDAVKNVEEAKEDETEPAEVQKVVDVVTTTKLITKVVTAASETVTGASAIITTVEAQVPAATTATLIDAHVRVVVAPSRRRKGVVIKDPEEESTTSTIIPTETKSKDKGKGILVEQPKPLKKKQQIELDEQYARELHAELNKDFDWDESIDHVERKAKEDPTVKRYQAMKRKPQTEAQARKNIMMYLKNVVGFKLHYFKGMSYDDTRPIFEAKFNSNVAFLIKTKEQIEEVENRALQKIIETPAERAAKRRKLDEEEEDLKRNLQIVPNEDDDVYTEATSLARKVPVVDYEIIEMNNKPYYKIIRADGTHQLYISFMTLLRNFDREDLEALWSLVKERFSTTKPKNFSDDFLLTTLGAMFEKPDAHAQI